MKPRLIIHEFLKNARKIYQNFYICKNQSQTTAYHPKYHLKLQATLFVWWFYLMILHIQMFKAIWFVYFGLFIMPVRFPTLG